MKAWVITYADGKHKLIAGNLIGFETGIFGFDAKKEEGQFLTNAELEELVRESVLWGQTNIIVTPISSVETRVLTQSADDYISELKERGVL